MSLERHLATLNETRPGNLSDLSALESLLFDRFPESSTYSPERLVEWVRTLLRDATLTKDKVWEWIKEVMDKPPLAPICRPPKKPPPDFDFPGYRDATGEPYFDIDVNRCDFETPEDAARYFVYAGPAGWLHTMGVPIAGSIRRHSDYASRFEYTAMPEDDGSLRVALFADFANGYYHTQYLARLLAERNYRTAIHLGDTYFSGEESEVEQYLKHPLEPMFPTTNLFLMPGNHEMYRRGRYLLDLIDEKLHRCSGTQRQEGTYFRIAFDGIQIVAADTEWYGAFRFQKKELRDWLEEQLARGRKEKLVTVLLTGDEPYSYGKSSTTPLWDDLRPLLAAGPVHLWFWGNTHYAGLFQRDETFPFYGSCIGHGGYPYDREKPGRHYAATPLWIEFGSRFLRNDMRDDVGSNGFCELRWDPKEARVALDYIDWMGNSRLRAALDAVSGELTLCA